MRGVNAMYPSVDALNVACIMTVKYAVNGHVSSRCTNN